MLKLYKRIRRTLHYHEAWIAESMVIEHWGKVGERGETVTHKRRKRLSEDKSIEKVLSNARAEGFEPIARDNHTLLLIEFRIDGMGTPSELKKRHALQARMDETLGWTGLGRCTGGSIGSGTMEVECLVVDVKVAKKVIAADLKDTEFADYSQIKA